MTMNTPTPASEPNQEHGKVEKDYPASVGARVTVAMKELIDETSRITGFKVSDLMREFVDQYWSVFAAGKRHEREQMLKQIRPLSSAQKQTALKAKKPRLE